MRERPNRTVSKTVEAFGLRGFKSHSLRNEGPGQRHFPPTWAFLAPSRRRGACQRFVNIRRCDFVARLVGGAEPSRQAGGWTMRLSGPTSTTTAVTRLPEVDYGGVLADQRTAEREVLDALRRQPDTGFAIHDAPGRVQRLLAERAELVPPRPHPGARRRARPLRSQLALRRTGCGLRPLCRVLDRTTILRPAGASGDRVVNGCRRFLGRGGGLE